MNLKKLLWPQVYTEFKECEKKKFKFKIFKVMKFMFKILFSQLLLCITFDDRFEDLILILCIWVPNLTIEVIMKNNQIFNNILLPLIGIWPRKPRLSYTIALVWSTLLCLHPRLFVGVNLSTRRVNRSASGV